jgi:hypothetical protein
MSETVTFEADGVEHTAIVGEPRPVTTRDHMVREIDGQLYAIYILMGQAVGYPGVGFVACPVEEENDES